MVNTLPANFLCTKFMGLNLILVVILNLVLSFFGGLPAARAKTKFFMAVQGAKLVINNKQ